MQTFSEWNYLAVIQLFIWRRWSQEHHSHSDVWRFWYGFSINGTEALYQNNSRRPSFFSPDMNTIENLRSILRSSSILVTLGNLPRGTVEWDWVFICGLGMPQGSPYPWYVCMKPPPWDSFKVSVCRTTDCCLEI